MVRAFHGGILACDLFFDNMIDKIAVAFAIIAEIMTGKVVP
jgi:hypothetical protein